MTVLQNGWNDTTLGKLVTLQRGHDLTETERRSGLVPVLGSAGQNGYHDTALAKGPGAVIGRSGASFGEVHYSPYDYWPHNTVLYVKDFGGNDPRFVYYLLKSLDLKRFNSGTAQPSLNRNYIYPISLKVPPPAKQSEIAWILGALDDKIELNKQINSTLETMARALFQSWFVDFDPVRAKAEGRTPENLDEATAALFPDRLEDSELGPVPLGWPAKALPELLEVNPRRVLAKGANAPYLDMKNLPTQGHCAEDVIERQFSSGSKFKNGDTLLARITPCLENGKTGFVDFLEDDQVGWGSTEFIVFAPKPPLPAQFGYLLARSEPLRKHAIQNMTGTSGRQRVPAECFETFFIAQPPPKLGERFGEFTAPLMEKIKANADEARVLTKLRDTLLPKLLNGELSVAECESKIVA